MAPKKNQSTMAPATLQKELQRAVSLACLAKIYKGNTMKKHQMVDLMADLFHGNETKGYSSMAKQAVQGDGIFARVWDIEEEKDLEDREVGRVLTLKKPLSRDFYKDYNAGVHFNLSSISKANQNGDHLISGRTLLSNAEEVMKNCRKAMSHVHAFLDRDGNFPSGRNDEDLDKYVLDQMYKYEVSDEDGDSSGTEKKRPTAWFFNGWFGFKAFGPTAGPHKLSILVTGKPPSSWTDPKGKKNNGQDAARKNDAKRKEVEHQNVPGWAAGLKDIIASAALSQKEKKEEARHHENNLMALACMNTSLHKQLEMKEKMMCNPNLPKEVFQKLWDEIDDLEKQISENERCISDHANKKFCPCTEVSDVIEFMMPVKTENKSPATSSDSSV